MNISFFTSTSKKIEKIDDVLVEVQTEMNMTSRKVETCEKKARDLMKKAVGASRTQKQMIALQVKKEYDTSMIHQRTLTYYFTVYKAALSLKHGLETRQLESAGAMRMLQKIVGAGNLHELQGVMRDLARDEQKLGARFQEMGQQIDQTQEELSATAMTDTSFLDIMNEIENLPPEKIEETLNNRVRFDSEKA